MRTFIKGFKDGFTDFGHNVSTIVNSVLLSVVYFVGVGPTSLAARVFGKSFITSGPEEDTESYWTDFEHAEKGLENHYRQF